MNAFVAAASLDRAPLNPQILAEIDIRARTIFGCPIEWHDASRVAFGTVGGHATRGGMLAQSGDVTGVGRVRFQRTHPLDAGRLASDSSTDLETALAAVARYGPAAVRPMIGDFAFAAWHPNVGELIAARDAFGVRSLFVTTAWKGAVVFGSHARLLTRRGEYDRDY